MIVRLGGALIGYPDVHSIFLFSSNFKTHPCKASKSVPTGPELPKIFRANDLIMYYVMSTRIELGIYLYVSNMAQE